MTPEEADAQRKRDETQTLVSDFLPKVWRSVYVNCVAEGFKESEAFVLVLALILKDGGIHFPKQ